MRDEDIKDTIHRIPSEVLKLKDSNSSCFSFYRTFSVVLQDRNLKAKLRVHEKTFKHGLRCFCPLRSLFSFLPKFTFD